MDDSTTELGNVRVTERRWRRHVVQAGAALLAGAGAAAVWAAVGAAEETGPCLAVTVLVDDSNESPLIGIAAELRSANRTEVVARATTDAAGKFCMEQPEDLLADYQLRLILRDTSGWFSVESEPSGEERPFTTSPAPSITPVYMDLPIVSADWAGVAPSLDVFFRSEAGATLDPVREVSGSSIDTDDLTGAAYTYHHSLQFLRGWAASFGTDFGTKPVAIVIGNQRYVGSDKDDNTFYNPTLSRVHLDAFYTEQQHYDFADTEPSVAPDVLWHELTHHAQEIDGFTERSDQSKGAGDTNHGGWPNKTSADSLLEGSASFWAAVAPRIPSFGISDVDDGAFSNTYSIEWNRWKAWTSTRVGARDVQREDRAVTALLWDLYDPCAASCERVVVGLLDGSVADVPEDVQISPLLLMRTLRDLPAGDVTVAGLREALIAGAELDSTLTDVTVDLDGKKGADVSRLDVAFIAHGFYPCNTDDNPQCFYELGSPVGTTDHESAGLTGNDIDGNGLEDRRFDPPTPGSLVRLENPTAQIVDVLVDFDADTLTEPISISLDPGEVYDLALELPPSFGYPITDTVDVPPCLSDLHDALTGVTISDSIGGSLTFDSATSAEAVNASGGAPAMTFVAGDSRVRFLVELVPPGTPGAVDLGESFPEVLADLGTAVLNGTCGGSGTVDGDVSAANIAHRVQLAVPGFEQLVDVTMPGTLIEYSTAEQRFSFDGPLVIDDTVVDLDVTVDVDDETLDASVAIAGVGGASAATADELEQLIGTLLDDPDAMTDRIPDELSLKSISGDVHVTPGRQTAGLTAAVTLPKPSGPGRLDADVVIAVDHDADDLVSPTDVLLGARVVDPDCGSYTDLEPCIELDGLLPLPGGGIAGELRLPAIDLLYADEGFDPTLLGPDAAALLAELRNGASGPVPAHAGLHVEADLALDPLNGLLDAVGAPTIPAQSVRMTGDFGFDLGALADGSAASLIDSIDLRASIDTGGVPPAQLPDWFRESVIWPDSVELFVAYNAATSRIDLGVAVPGVGTTLVDPDDPPEFDLSAFVSGDLEVGSFAATVIGELSEPWEQPLDIKWLTIEGLQVEIELEVADSTRFEITLSGHVLLGASGKPVSITLEIEALGDDPSAVLTVGLEAEVTVADVVGELLTEVSLPVDPLDALPDIVKSAGFGPAELVIAVDGAGLSIDLIVAEMSFELVAGNPVSLTGMLSAEFPSASGSEPRFVVGVQPNPGLRLSALLPGVTLPEVDGEPIDFELTSPGGSAFGFVFSTESLAPNDPSFPDATQAWLAPLFGAEPGADAPGGRTLPNGFGVLGAFQLPEPVDELVSTLGIEPNVFASGSLDLDTFAVEMELGLQVSDEILPQWIHQAGLALKLQVDPANLSLSLRLEGNLTLQILQGIDPNIADGLADLGVDLSGLPIPIASEVGAGECDGAAETVDAVVYDGAERDFCFDLLSVEVGADITVEAPSLKIFVDASIYAGPPSILDNPPDEPPVWRPFGMDFVGLTQTKVQLGLNFTPGPTPLSVELGVLADVEIAGKRFQGGIQIGVAPLPNPPWATVTFGGLSVATPPGLAVQDLVDLQQAAALFMQEIDPAGPWAPLDDAVTGVIPDVAVRNLEFSISPTGVPSLCIPAGVVIRGDLYVNPTGAPPTGGPGCDGEGGYQPPPSAELCENNAANGCVAGIYGSLTPAGLFANGFVTSWDLGPLHANAAVVDLALPITVLDARLRVEGGFAVDGLGSGYAELALGLANARLEAELEVLDLFEAYVAGDLALTLEDGLNGGIEVVFRGNSTFTDDLAARVDEAFQPLTDLAEAVELGLEVWSHPIPALVELGVLSAGTTDYTLVDQLVGAQAAFDRLAGTDAERPIWLTNEFIDLVRPVVEAGEDVADAILGVVCLGDFDPADGYGDATGFPCTLSTLTASTTDGLLAAFAAFDATVDDVARFVSGGGFGVNCARFGADLGTSLAGSGIELGAEVVAFGDPYDLGISWTFPENVDLASAFTDFDALFTALQALVFEGASEVDIDCETGFPAEPLVADAFVLEVPTPVGVEGTPFALNGDVIPPGSGATVSVDWGDSTGVSSPTLTDGAFTAAHTYGDNGFYPVEVCVSTVIECQTVGVSIANATPSVDTLSVPGVVDEGAEVVLAATYYDPGVGDTHAAVVDWGDGTSNTPVAAAGSIGAVHRYADDGEYQVQVCVIDDDRARSCREATVMVENAAPSVSGLSLPNDPGEGDEVALDVTIVDRGTLDTHVVLVDWGDGTPGSGYDGVEELTVTENPSGPPGSAAGLTGTAAGVHHYADEGTYTVEVCVTDDDDPTPQCTTQQLEVENVAPSLDEPVPAGVLDEGSVIALSAGLTDQGSLDAHRATIDWGDGSPLALARTVYASPPTGPPGTAAGREGTVTGAHVYADDGMYDVTVCVIEDPAPSGATEACTTVAVTIGNVAPTVAIDRVGDGPNFFLPFVEISLAAGFNDPGTLDTHTASIDWDDGTTEATPVVEFPFGPPGSTAGLDGSLGSAHTYLVAGDYDVTVVVTDDELANGSATTIVEVVTPDEALERTIELIRDVRDGLPADDPAREHLDESLKDLEGTPEDRHPQSGALDKLRDGDDAAALAKLGEAVAELELALGVSSSLDVRDELILLGQISQSIAASTLAEVEATLDMSSPGAVKQLAQLTAVYEAAVDSTVDARVEWDTGFDPSASAAILVEAIDGFHQVVREGLRLL